MAYIVNQTTHSLTANASKAFNWSHFWQQNYPSYANVTARTIILPGLASMVQQLGSVLETAFLEAADDSASAAAFLVDCLISAAVILLFASLWACVTVVQGYRQMVYETRAQKITLWENDRQLYTPFYTASFFLSHAVYHHIPYVIFLPLITVTLFSFGTEDGREFWGEMILPQVLTIGITYLVSSVLLRIFIWDRYMPPAYPVTQTRTLNQVLRRRRFSCATASFLPFGPRLADASNHCRPTQRRHQVRLLP